MLLAFFIGVYSADNYFLITKFIDFIISMLSEERVKDRLMAFTVHYKFKGAWM